MDIGDWLRGLGLSQYETLFRQNDIDAEVLSDLTDGDLEKFGVSFGHRKRLLKAIASLGSTETAAKPATPVPPQTSPDVAERQQLTVMFCDLVGSTALSARLDPEDMREVVGVYHRLCADLIAKARGFVAKYMGDGVLAYFGYPQAHEHDAEHAVQAGLALVEAIGKLNTAAGAPLQVRVGIATGLVVVGDLIGAGSAHEQAVVGETSNLAARLQALAEPGTVVIAEGTRRLLGSLFELRDLGVTDLKGIAAPVGAWAALRPSSVESRFEALHTTGLTALVGREEEFELLLRRWTRSKTGQGQVVLLSGEAGIGKSRLTAALMERLAGEPHTRLRYFCSPHHQDSALYPSIAQLERAAGFRREDTAEERLAKLEEVLAKATNDLSEAVPLLADLLSIPTGDRYPPLKLTPQKRKEKMLHAQLAQVEGLATQQPMLIVWEDVHWSDPTTRELLDLLIDRVATLQVLVIVTFRPEFAPGWIGRSHVTMLNLNRLAPRQRAEMIMHLTGGRALPEEIAKRIVDRTDGVPLFIEELTKSVIESGIVVETGDQYAAIDRVAALTIPTSLHASLLARLDRLAPVREVAQIGAALGRSFSYELICAVAAMPQQQLADALAQLERAELVFRRGTPPDAEYTFKHALVQDAAYSTLLRSRRKQLHERIVAAIESQFSDLAMNDPERLGQHCMEAGQVEGAIEYWHRAAEASISRSANVEAVRQTDRALEALRGLPESAERNARELRLLVPRGVGLQALYGYGSQQVHANYARANEICRNVADIPDLVPVLRGLYVHHLMQGSLPAAHQIGAHLLRLADQAGDEGWRLEARFAFGQTLAFHEGDFARARDMFAEGESLYDFEKHGRHALVYGQDPGVYCLVLGGWMHYFLGYPDTAFSKMRRAIQLADTVGHPLSCAAARTFTIQLLQWLRTDTGVPELATETASICEAHRLPFFRAWTDASLACRLISDGEVELGRQKMAVGP